MPKNTQRTKQEKKEIFRFTKRPLRKKELTTGERKVYTAQCSACTFGMPRFPSCTFASFVIKAFPSPQILPLRMLESMQTSRMLPDIENLLKLQDADKEIRRLQDEVRKHPGCLH